MSNSKKTILVVDDEPEIRESLIFFLEHRNFRILQASGGLEALNLLGRESVDLVLSDIRMPGEDNSGLYLLAKIQDVAANTPVILMTGYADMTIQQAVDLGARALVEKPFRMHELAMAIEKILEE